MLPHTGLAETILAIQKDLRPSSGLAGWWSGLLDKTNVVERVVSPGLCHTSKRTWQQTSAEK